MIINLPNGRHFAGAPAAELGSRQAERSGARERPREPLHLSLPPDVPPIDGTGARAWRTGLVPAAGRAAALLAVLALVLAGIMAFALVVALVAIKLGAHLL